MALDLSGFRLTYDDEFNSFTSSPNGSSGYKTTFYFGGRSLPSNGEQEYYSDSSVGVNPFSLSNGQLTITASPGNNPGGLAYNSGLITTEGMFTQTYGYFEMRAQLAQGAGMWPAFWLLPADKSWPPEIDALEAFGATNANGEGGATKAHVGAITSDWSTGGGGDWVTMPGGANMYTGYHTYGVDWEPDFITYYIDGQQVYQVKTPFDANKPMYMLANLAVGGNWVGSPAGETGQMKIDYIRAFSKDTNATGIALQTVSSPDGVNTGDLHGALTGDGTVPNAGTLVVRVSEDAWNGDAQFTVSVDGVRVGGIYTATAIHGQGQWQDISITGSFGSSGSHTVDVTFINDGWGGTPSTDRNLYIQSITLNGQSVAGSTATGPVDFVGSDAQLYANGTASFTASGAVVSDTLSSATSATLDAITKNLLLTGTAAINGTGNALDNTITGNNADNVLDGKAGADTMIGGLGNDTYYMDNPGDVIVENPGEGTDTLITSINYSLNSLVNLENITLIGTAVNAGGNAGANVVTGTAADNMLWGNAGNDTVIGGAGNDTLFGGNWGGDNSDDPSGNDSLDGGSGNDVLYGQGGNDTLVGGTGNDTLTGGTGADVFVFNTGDGRDTITDFNHAQGDAIQLGLGAFTSFSAIMAVAVDNGVSTTFNFSATDSLTLLGVRASSLVAADFGLADSSAITSGVSTVLGAGMLTLTLTGTADINGTGNALDNTITGNSGNNVLDGGAGADTLIGGLGNDTYIMDNPGDVIVENPGEGTDTLVTSIHYSLNSLVNVENITLTGGAIYGGGNAGDNVVTANNLGNMVWGNDGNDTIIGGSGNDTLFGGNWGGTSADDPFGNDSLVGGAGNDALYGQGGNDTLVGGTGNDTLTGGTGADVFVFNTGDGRDTITDFTTQQDTIRITGVAGIASFADIQAHATQVGADLVLQLGVGDAITLNNVTLSALHNTDFVFA